MEKRNNGAKHERHYFRILRPEEDINYIRAKDPEKEPPCDEGQIRQSIQEHIRSGSTSGYKSPWVSVTAELNVALAFAGKVARIAIISSSDLEKEKSKSEIVHLDKEYLRTILTDTDAVKRSRRSDEVLVFKEIKCAKLLKINLDKTAERRLNPQYEADDATIFPVLTPNKIIKTIKMIAGSNKRLFQLEIDGKNWIASLPRPNFDLNSPVLFNEELVQLCEHQFATFCAYRSLNAPVPKCALYVFQLSVNNTLRNGSYKSAFILMENMEACLMPEEALNAARTMLPIDLLLGNWDPVGGVDNSNKMIRKETGAFFKTSKNIVVRVTLDRALGCIYPEDRTKPEKEKMIIEFKNENVGYLQKCLQKTYNWCYGSVEQKDLVQMIMDMNIVNPKRLKRLKSALYMSPGLPWKQEEKIDLWTIVQDRIEHLLAIVPYREITSKSAKTPVGRDGHGAISYHNADAMKMFVCGGNSIRGALKDLWEFNLTSKKWTRLEDMPSSGGRYSFSMHLLLQRYIIIYGGCHVNVSRRPEVVGDVFLFDIEKREWHTISNLGTNVPAARCRHGSYLVNLSETHAELFIVAGYDKEGRKRDDTWKLNIVKSQSDSHFTWERLNNLKGKTHRCFLFAHRSAYYLLGGFGRNLRSLEEVNLGKTVVTHSYLNLPASEKESFMDSKSLAGFGAVYDDVGERVIVIGGGNVGTRNGNGGSSPRNKVFGNVPEDQEVTSKPRILCLNYVKDSEWAWQTKHLYDSLDDEHKLPDLLHWSAVYIDHSVYLFGGRNNDVWSDKMFKVQLRPEFKDDLDNIKEDAVGLRNGLYQLYRKYTGKNEQKMLLDTIRCELRELAPDDRLE